MVDLRAGEHVPGPPARAGLTTVLLCPFELDTGPGRGQGGPFTSPQPGPTGCSGHAPCTRSEGKLRDPRGDRGGSVPAPPPLLDHERVQRRKGTETGPRAEPRPGGEGHAQRGRRGPQTGLGPILAPTTVLSVSSVCRPVKPSVIRMDLSIRCRAWRACPPGPVGVSAWACPSVHPRPPWPLTDGERAVPCRLRPHILGSRAAVPGPPAAVLGTCAHGGPPWISPRFGAPSPARSRAGAAGHSGSAVQWF